MPIEPVVVDFVARGVTDVGRAFDTIDRRLANFETRAVRIARDGSKQRVRIAQDEEKEKERAYDKLAREIQREEDKRTSQLAREEKKRTQIVEREETQRRRTAEREADKLERYKMRVRIRSSEMHGRAVAREVEEEARAARRSASGVAGAGTRAIGRGAMMLGGVAAIAGIGGGFMIADAVRERAAAGRNASLLVNAVTGAGGIPQGASVSSILGGASQVSRETGMGVGDVTRGALEYSRRARGGDFEGVMANMSFFAKMANVTGADIGEIAGAAGTLQSQNADLGGKNNARMQDMLMAAYAQSKQGSISMTEAAKQIGTLGSTRGLYQGVEAVNQQKLLGLGQIAASGGNVEDVGTYIKDLSLEAAAHRHRTKKTLGLEDDMGVKFDKYGRMESPEEMVAKVFKSTGGDLGKIHAIFGNRGMPLFTELQKSFINAGAGEKGMAAVKAQIAGVTSATMTPKDLEQQNEQMLLDPAKKFELAVTRIKDTLMTSMEPALTRVAEKMQAAAPEIEKIIRAGGDLAAWLAENPMRAALTVMGAGIAREAAKSVANAAIGEAMKAAIANKMLTGLNIATATLIIGSLMAPKGGNETDQIIAAASSDAGNIRSGLVKPTDIAVQEHRAALQKRKAELEQEIAHPTGPLGETVARGARAILDPVTNALGINDFDKQLKSVTAALAELEKQTKSTGPLLAANTAAAAAARNVNIADRPKLPNQ